MAATMGTYSKLSSLTRKFALNYLKAAPSYRLLLNSDVHPVSCIRNITRICCVEAPGILEKKYKNGLQGITEKLNGIPSPNLYRVLASPCSTAAGVVSSSQVEDALNILKMKLERMGQLNRSDLIRTVKCLEQHKDQLNDDQCCRVLRAAVRVAGADYRPCGRLVNRIWNLTVDRPNAKLTHEHVELYLEACMISETPCTLQEIMPTLKKHELDASGSLLCLLMSVAGVTRDTESAAVVLAAMKERGVPATLDTFTALLMAHAASRDAGGVMSVEEAMRSMKMSGGSRVLAALLTGHAWAGEEAAMRQITKRAEKLALTFSQAQLAPVLLALVRAGHTQQNLLNWVVGLMKEGSDKGQFEASLSHTALQLIHLGHARDAFHLLHHLPRLTTNTHLYSNAALYIKEAVKANTAPDVVVELCSYLSEKGISTFGLVVALECALRDRREEAAWAFLRALKQIGATLREHYFWPLLHYPHITTQKVLSCVKEMVSLGVTPGVESLEYHVLPALPSVLTDPTTVARQLHLIGLPRSTIDTPILATLIRKNAFEEAAKFVEESQNSFSLENLTLTLGSAWSSSPQVITAILAKLIARHNQGKQELDKSRDVKEDWGGQFVLDMAASRRSLGDHTIQPLFKELKKHHVGISQECVELLLSRSNMAIQEAVKAHAPLVLDPSLGSPPREIDNDTISHPRSMTADELEGHLVELTSKGMNPRGTLRRLLLSHATTADTAHSNTQAHTVLELSQQAKEGGMKLSAGMIASVLKAQIKNGEVDAALQSVATLSQQQPHFSLDHYKVIDLCTLMVKEHRGQEAVQTLRKHLYGDGKNGNKSTAKVHVRGVRRNCRALLMASAALGDYHLTRDFLDLLLTRGLVVPDNLALGSLIKCRLVSGDLTGAVDETEDIFKKHKCLPMRVETLIHLIHNCGEDNRLNESSDEWLLVQVMVKLIERHNGSSNAHHDLFFACLEADRPILAAKILKKLNSGLHVERMRRQVERYGETQRDGPLLHMLSVTLHTTGTIDRHNIYHTLLNIYCVRNDVDKGLDLWTRMQDENTIPNRTFLTTLSTLLTNHNRHVPFIIS